MIDQLWKYIISLYKEVPISVYEDLIALLCIGSVIILCIWGFRRGWRKICLLLLGEYIYLLFGSTVIYREASDAISGHCFYLLWSYRAYLIGENPNLLVENIMNILVFVPVGILVGTLLSQKGWLVAFLVGAGISVSIESLQFLLHRGFAELDDVIHNTTGCVMGYILVKGLRVMVLERAKRQS